MLLPQPPKCWGYRQASPHLAYFYSFFFVVEIEPKILYMLGKHSTTQLHPRPSSCIFARFLEVKLLGQRINAYVIFKRCHKFFKEVITEVLGQKSNSRGFTYQVQPLAPICQIKRWIVVKGRERRFVMWPRHAAERGKISTLAFLGVQIWALGLYRGRIEARARGMCIY
jgi:hypothetical protein